VEFFETQIGAQVILSPIDGVVSVTKRPNAILTVMDQLVMELQVPVSDFDINLIRPGQPVRVKVRSYPTEIFWGSVVRVPKTTTDSTAAMHFPIAVAVKNSEARLTQGMTGYAKIDVGEKTLLGRAARKVLSVIRVEFWSWWLW
jgi:multidrug efflux pump subunit AcrA (membrane-fusion protein)